MKFIDAITNSKLWQLGCDNSQYIMAGAAAIGVFGTAILSYCLRPIVDGILAEQRAKVEELDNSDKDDTTKAAERKAITKETVKEIVVAAAPTAACSLATAGLAMGATVNATHKMQHWMDVARISDATNNALFGAIDNTVPEEQANEIRKEAIKRKDKAVNEDVEFPEDLIIETGDGNQLFYDALCGRVFRSSVEAIHEAVTRCIKRMGCGAETYITLNEFYAEANLPSIMLGEDRAWGGFTPTGFPEENLNNAIRFKNFSAIVLDWRVRPMLNYK